MAPFRRTTQDGVWVLFELFIWDGLVAGYLVLFSRSHVEAFIQLTGSSVELIPKMGILAANSESEDEASR